MSEPKADLVSPQTPISVVLQAQALSTDTESALRSWQKHLDRMGRAHEILLLQETRTEVVPAPAPGARVIAYDRGIGPREAMVEAIRSARYPLLAFCPCDLQYLPDDLDRMLKVMEYCDEQSRQPDLVVGYRVGLPVPLRRVLFDMVFGMLSWVVIGAKLMPTECWLGWEGWRRRLLARWVFGLRVADPECPFRLFRRESWLQRLPIQSRGSFAQIEMLAKANHLGCLIAEQAVTWTPPASAPEATSFAEDAWQVFHRPEFRISSPTMSAAIGGGYSS
jgi:hypothetical protein